MNFLLPILLTLLSMVSLTIGIFQFIDGRTVESILSFIYSVVFFIGIFKVGTFKKGNEMNKQYFKKFLIVSAFLLPVYFVFYPKLNDYKGDKFVKSLWISITAGFCFYAILILSIHFLR